MDQADEAQESKRNIGFSVPHDRPDFLAAFGVVAILSGHVDYLLKMMIRNLGHMPFQQARKHTARWSSSRLREKVLKLAKLTNMAPASCAELTALLARCEGLSEKRNALIHGLIGEELDGNYVVASDVGRFEPLPTVGDLKDWADALIDLRGELNRFLVATIWPHVGREF